MSLHPVVLYLLVLTSYPRILFQFFCHLPDFYVEIQPPCVDHALNVLSLHVIGAAHCFFGGARDNQEAVCLTICG